MDVSHICEYPLSDLLGIGEFACTCGRTHAPGTARVIIESGAVQALPGLLAERQIKRPFLLSGEKTFQAAGEQVQAVLKEAGVLYSSYVFPHSPVVPAEHSVGSAVMHFDSSCDGIVGIGSGVVNDIGKLLAAITGKPYLIVATAPSMDGYASATSSMERDGLKVSLDSVAPWAVVGDLDILCQAPLSMLQAGVGDMVAKYISICEWQIARLLVGEDYCPVVASLVETALQRVVEAAPALKKRDPAAVQAVMEGLVIAGTAMKYAGLSRPASGVEHYFSHIWDMRSLAFAEAGTMLHGLQCGIATLYALRVYEYLRSIKPNRDTALGYVKGFSAACWEQELTEFIGPGAGAMIAAEKREGKYDPKKHRLRLEVILERWEEILSIIDTLPSYDEVHRLLTEIGAPTSAAAFGYTPAEIRKTFVMTKDIRDKYIASRLLWDLGLLQDAAEAVVFE